MTLAPGSRIGPYQIVAILGAGGMGEVYRARDGRIGRDVAVKVLPPAFAASPDRVQRFELEARAAGGLTHPSLLTIFDVGTQDGIPYIVSELLEGSTLRERLASGSGLASRRAVDYAAQIARGAAVAHEKGIVHRDLKPENIFITDDDRVKLLDFGLAKVLIEEETVSADAPTEQQARPDTAAGVVMGTAAYMSPEQVRAQPVDHRTDVFSLGVVLYEMLSGVRPFSGSSHVETMASILNDDPPSLPPSIPPALERIVLHAVEKSPAQRFQSMKDVAFALETFSSTGETHALGKTKSRSRAAKPAPVPARQVKYHRVSYRRGFVMSARFAPDQSVVYGASWEDRPNEIFAAFPANPESRPVGLVDADVLAIAPGGEMAISLGRRFVGGWVTSGTLARIPLFGGAPRELAEEVQDADWYGSAPELAVIRRGGDRFSLEMPLGNPIYETPYWISNVRVSPKGNLVAFLQHEVWGDDGGRIVIIDSRGERRVESSRYHSMAGTAWTHDGDEVWVAAHHETAGRDLMALSVKGKERVVLPIAGRYTIHDIGRDGRVLVSVENGRREIVTGTRGDDRERNISWLDWSFLCGLSPDGKRVLIEEQAGARRNEANPVYVRGADGSPAVRLTEGTARGISPDGRLIAVIPPADPGSMQLLPVGVGTPRTVSLRGLEGCNWWEWTPDGKQLLIWAHHGDAPSRHFALDLGSDAPPRPITPPGSGWTFAISPDSTRVAAMMPDRTVAIVSLAGGDPVPVRGCEPGDRPSQWSADGESIFVFKSGRLAIDFERVEIETGKRTLWHPIRPADPAGIMDITPVYLTRDGMHYAYSYRRFLSDLYVVEGLL